MMIRGEMTERGEKEKPGEGGSLIWLLDFLIRWKECGRRAGGEVELKGRKQRGSGDTFTGSSSGDSDGNCRQTCPKWRELSTSDILCLHSRVFIPGRENKWQELECQDVLRGSWYLLLKQQAPTCRPLRHPGALLFPLAMQTGRCLSRRSRSLHYSSSFIWSHGQ